MDYAEDAARRHLNLLYSTNVDPTQHEAVTLTKYSPGCFSKTISLALGSKNVAHLSVALVRDWIAREPRARWILVHNHTTAAVEPSAEDLQTTELVTRETLGALTDHVICRGTPDGYVAEYGSLRSSHPHLFTV